MKLLSLFIKLCFLSSIPQVLCAQIPPVFESAYASKIQRDELTRVFISPQRVVWKHAGDGSLVMHEEEPFETREQSGGDGKEEYV